MICTTLGKPKANLFANGTAVGSEVTVALEAIERVCVEKLHKGDVERVNRINRIYLEAFEQELLKLEGAR